MNINISNNIVITNCNTCSKKSVCKFEKDYIEYWDKVNAISKPLLAPFRATIKCNEYVENVNTRDYGINIK